MTLNATITDALVGVKNATVNVSGINLTINERILTNQSGYWKSTIIADRAETTLKNLTITTYDYSGNGNKSVNMTVGIDNTPPTVTSNTNNVILANGSYMTLNTSITDALSGVKNATVNVSAANKTINQAILTLSGGNWINTTIIADRGSIGLVNLTITAYDNVSNVNTTVNMTIRLPLPPSIISWSNNYTNNNSLLFDVPASTYLNFNITVNQTVTYSWIYDTVDQGKDFNNFTQYFTTPGLHTINTTISNSNGTSSKNWTITVVQEVIDVTLSNTPIDFGNLTSGFSNKSAFLPMNVTIQNTTNVNVNLTLNGTNFTSGIYSFNVGKLNYSNLSNGIKTNMTTSFPSPYYSNWVNIPKKNTTVRSIYFWISIPNGQEAGLYSNNVNVKVERYS